MEFHKGYIRTQNKAAVEELKAENLRSYNEIKRLPEFAGVLADDVILIDIDDLEQSDVLFQIISDLDIQCRVYKTTRGKHFLFRNDEVRNCGNHLKLACGLTADIKVGKKTSYQILKVANEEREILRDSDDPDFLPRWLTPVKSKYEFYGKVAGESRNSDLFGYENILGSRGFTNEEIRETIQIINKYVFIDPLPERELEIILRDDALAKPNFFDDKKFKFNEFSDYIMRKYHVYRINGALSIYCNGIYTQGYSGIEAAMQEEIPFLKRTQRTECLAYMELKAPEKSPEPFIEWVAFRNGLLNLRTDEFRSFSPEFIVTNKIPHDYNPKSTDESIDKLLSKLACQDETIVRLLEECVGFCLWRRNEIGKAVVLVGEKGSNGKSTYLELISYCLGLENIASLDLDEMGERFSVASLVGKLANVGDDINDDYIPPKTEAIFKKIVTGNAIKAENKGQTPFMFKPTCKLLFSANNIPRFKAGGLGAVKRRLIIIPFNAVFRETDPDYEPEIIYRIKTENAAEALINKALAGLKRILDKGFTQSEAVKKELDEFERTNDPLQTFFEDYPLTDGRPTADYYMSYQVFCSENQFKAVTKTKFSRSVKARLGMVPVPKRVGSKTIKVYSKGD